MANALAIDFDPAPHAYRLNGKAVPSVTQVLAPLYDWSGIPPRVLEAARWRGQMAHEACHLDNLGHLDLEAQDPVLQAFVTSWREWQRLAGATIIASEVRVASPRYGYAGTPDVIADLKGRLVLIDIKATAEVPKPTGPQTAGYAQAYRETFGRRIDDRLVVRIDQRPGKHQSRRLTDPADWPVFVSCLNIFRWNENNR